MERRFHPLKPGKQTSQPEMVIYFDSESNVDPVTLTHTNYLLCATFIRYRKSQSKKGKVVVNKPVHKIYADHDTSVIPVAPNFWMGCDISKYTPIQIFWKDVDNFTKSGKKTTIYAHNVGYDINATKAIHNLVKLGYILTSAFDKGSYILTMRKVIDDKHAKVITFINTGNYFSGTLAKLAETFGIPAKIDFDFKKGTFLEAIPYCIRDVYICQMAMEGFRKLLTDNDLGTMKSTIASQAFTTFCYKFLQEDKPIFIHDNEQATQLERLSYHGGRTENFKRGTFHGEHFKEDVNSMYPSVMAEERFPTKLLTYWKTSTVENLKQVIKQGKGVVATVKIHESNTNPHTAFQDTTKLIFPGGTFTVTLCTPELIPLLRDNKVLSVGAVSIYKMAYIFTEYVNYFYEKRNVAKANGDDMLSAMFKLFLNALYGKFGQKSDSWVLDKNPKIPGNPDDFEISDTYDQEGNFIQTTKRLGGSVFYHEPATESFNAFCAIASHVTSYARAKLARCMDIVGRENLFYCDTDSLFVNKIGHLRLQEAGELSNTILGKLKLESKYKGDLILHGAKDYVWGANSLITAEEILLLAKGELKDKTKGLLITKNGKTYWKGKRTLKGIGKNDTRILDPTDPHKISYSCLQWPKLSRLLQKGDYDKYSNVRIVKILKRNVNSGYLQPDGTITPYIMRDGQKEGIA